MTERGPSLATNVTTLAIDTANSLNTHAFTLMRSLLLAHNALTPPNRLAFSKDTRGFIREKSLSVVINVPSAVRTLVTSRNTCRNTQRKNL